MVMFYCANQNHGQDILHDRSGKQAIEPPLVLTSGHIMLHRRCHYFVQVTNWTIMTM